MTNIYEYSIVKDFKNQFTKRDLVFIPLIFLIISDIILIISKLQIAIFPLVNRLTYVVPFNPSISGVSIIDNLIITAAGYLFVGFLTKKLYQRISVGIVFVFIATIILNLELTVISYIQLLIISIIIGLIIVYNHKKNKSSLKDYKPLLNSTILFLLSFEIIVLSLWGLHVLSPDIEQSQIWNIVKLESEVFYLLGLLSPSILLLIVFSFFSKQIFSTLKVILTKSDVRSSNLKNSQLFQFKNDDSKKLLYLALILSILLTFYYHSPNINLPDYDLSVDIPFYVNWLDRLDESSNLSELFNIAFVEINDGDRGGSLIIFYVLQKTLVPDMSTNVFVTYLPVFLAPFFVFSSYYLARAFGKSKFTSSIVSLFAVFSFQYIVGVYAGFFANWFTLSISFILFAFIIKYLKEPTFTKFLVTTALSLLILFSYIYLWTYIITVLIIFTAITVFHFRKQRKKLIPILLIFVIIGANFVGDFVKVTYLESRSGTIKSYELSSFAISSENFSERWRNIENLFSVYLGGFFTNTLILALAFFWCLQASHSKDHERLILSSFYAGIVVFLLEFASKIGLTILFIQPGLTVLLIAITLNFFESAIHFPISETDDFMYDRSTLPSFLLGVPTVTKITSLFLIAFS